MVVVSGSQATTNRLDTSSEALHTGHPMVLSDFLAQALAKYTEDEPWDQLTPVKQDRHRRLGALLAGELTKVATQLPPSTTQPTPPQTSPLPALDALVLSRDQAVEVCVAAPVTIDGKIGVLSPESIQTIFKECIKQLGAAA